MLQDAPKIKLREQARHGLSPFLLGGQEGVDHLNQRLPPPFQERLVGAHLPGRLGRGDALAHQVRRALLLHDLLQVVLGLLVADAPVGGAGDKGHVGDFVDLGFVVPGLVQQ